MFVFSKIFLLVLMPWTWLGAALLTGTILLWTRWHRTGRTVLTLTIAFIFLVTVIPVGRIGTLILEERFPQARNLQAPVHGIVVLGGAVDQYITIARGQAALKHGAERMTETVALAREFPAAKVVFTGGSASIVRAEKESVTARMFFSRMGLPDDRLVFEEESRNTWENAVFTKRLVNPKPAERWILVTSAAHMPRSMGVFRKVGWRIIPYPVDYSTRGAEDIYPRLNFVHGIGDFASVLREYSGLFAYRLLGRTDAFFPGPAPQSYP